MHPTLDIYQVSWSIKCNQILMYGNVPLLQEREMVTVFAS